MSDMVFAPAFAELDSEREVVLEEIAMYEDAPQDLVHDLISEAVFGDHALGRPVIGTAEVISTISADTVARYHATKYVPGNIVVSAAGNVDHDELLGLLESALARRSAEQPSGPIVRTPLVEAPPPRLRFQRKDTEQYHVCLGAPGISRSDRRRFAVSLLDAILGGSASSRLFQEIREKRGLAYAVYSFVSQYTDTGQIGVYVGTREDNLAEALAIAADQIADIASAEPARAGADPRQGEPEGAHSDLDGVDVDPDEPARQVADLGLRAALARPDRRRGRCCRGGVGLRARRHAARAGEAVRGVYRAGRGPAPRGARADHAVAADRCMRIVLHGRGGKVGTVLAPALEQAGHELVEELMGADATIDFTTPDAVVANVLASVAAGVPAVVGTSGWEVSAVDEAARARGVPVFYAPNFAIGAVLMMRFAAEAARVLEGGEIVELHHATKLDAPSGTAKATAAAMGGDVPIHSVRLPGLVAHQEVLLGGRGELLTIRHDALSREAYVAGVLLALGRLGTLPPGVTVGLDALL